MSTEPRFTHPVLGEIHGYSSLAEFDAAVAEWDARLPRNYAVGHNVAGYLPESDVYVVEDFESAKRSLIADLLFAADYAETDDIGNALALAAEEVNLWNGPDCLYVDMIDSPHCIPTAFWIVETDETPVEEEWS